jgi:hypothetical protein
MRREFDIEQLLRWRLERAESDAPLPPAGLHLLERARPWWELNDYKPLTRLDVLPSVEGGVFARTIVEGKRQQGR